MEGVLEGCLLFSCLLFLCFVLCFLCFEDLNGFEFLKFLIILLFGRWEEFELVMIRVRVQVSIIEMLLYSKNNKAYF